MIRAVRAVLVDRASSNPLLLPSLFCQAEEDEDVANAGAALELREAAAGQACSTGMCLSLDWDCGSQPTRLASSSSSGSVSVLQVRCRRHRCPAVRTTPAGASGTAGLPSPTLQRARVGCRRESRDWSCWRNGMPTTWRCGAQLFTGARCVV